MAAQSDQHIKQFGKKRMLVVNKRLLFFYFHLLQTAVMNQSIFQNSSFQPLLQTQTETIFSSLSSQTLKLKITHKTKSHHQSNTNNTHYECFIKNSQIQQKLQQYFQNLKQLNDYLKLRQNVKIDWDKGFLDIVAKGPTKKASYILLAQFKMEKMEKNCNFGQRQASSGEAEEWIDHLASEIIGIIQSKSKIKDRADSEKSIASKDELESCIEKLKKQMTASLENMKTQISSLRQAQKQINKVIQSHCISETMQNQTLKCHQRLLHQLQQWQQKKGQLEKRQQKAHQMCSSETQTKCSQVSKQIEQARKQIDQVKQMEISTFKELLSRELFTLQIEKVQQNFRNLVNAKFNQIGESFAKKEEIDVIIKKMQSLGQKVENLLTEALKKGEHSQLLQEKLVLQQKKLSQIEVKIEKQKTIEQRPMSAKKQSSESQTAGNPVMAQSWIDQNCSHFGRITLDKSTITMTSFGHARLFSKIPISSKPYFSIYISSMSKCIAIGIIDGTYKESVIYSEEPNAIIYQNDRKFYSGVKQMDKKGEGFSKEQTITVLIDSELGTILWKVGNGLRYSWQSDELRNKKIQWVPFIKLFDKGDKIQLLQ